MTADDPADAVLQSLAQLPVHTPRPSRDAHTRARCHDAMVRPSRGRVRAIDTVLGVAVAVYAAAIVAEGLRMLLR